MSGSVDHPEHYNSLGASCPGCGRPIECIDVVEMLTFNLGNAVKYVWRAGYKQDLLEDLKKARWYLDREIARLDCQRERERPGYGDSSANS